MAIMSELVVPALYLFGIGLTQHLAISHTTSTPQDKNFGLQLRDYAWIPLDVKRLYKHCLDHLQAAWLTGLEGLPQGKGIPMCFQAGATLTHPNPSKTSSLSTSV